MSETINVEAIFGENVFNDSVMKERLPKSVYKKLKQTIEDGSELDRGRGCPCDEGLGSRQWRDPLYPLVPAPYRRDR